MDDPLGGRADERTVLVGALDWYRAVSARKVEGMTTEMASRIMTPSGISPLGVIAHLTWAEQRWFRFRFAGDTTAETTVENEESFRIGPDDTITSVLDGYAAEVARAQRVIAGASLDDGSVEDAPHVGRFSLRWVLVHMLEETARHAGHLDLMCEQLDGRVGD
ncbi:MAG TPA: DinB family protein [Acidimicrobiia bacterium]